MGQVDLYSAGHSIVDYRLLAAVLEPGRKLGVTGSWKLVQEGQDKLAVAQLSL